MDFPPSKLARFLLASPRRLQGSFFRVLQTDKIGRRRNETNARRCLINRLLFQERKMEVLIYNHPLDQRCG